MNIKVIPLAISFAIACTHLSAIGECNISPPPPFWAGKDISSTGTVYSVINTIALNKVSMEVKEFASLNNYDHVVEVDFFGSGGIFAINNSGHIRSIQSNQSSVESVNINNSSKCGYIYHIINIENQKGKISFINDGTADLYLLNLSGNNSVHVENNNTLSATWVDLKGESIDFKNTGNYNANAMRLTAFRDISFVNTGALSLAESLEIYAKGTQGEVLFANTGTLEANINIFAEPDSNKPVTLSNTGVITGGIYAAGADDYDIFNSGTIQAPAGVDAINIPFSRYTNLLLAGDWEIDGRISIGGNLNTLGLTGSDDAVLDISRIRSGGSESDTIAGFSFLEKSGGSLWTLVGEQTSGGFYSANINSGALLLSGATLLMKPLNSNDKDDPAAARHSLYNNATLYTAGASTLNGSLVNNGRVYLNDGVSASAARPFFNSLTVTGNYNGQKNSTLLFNTRLGNDKSPSDRLIILGNTSGESQVIVNNLGGKGAKTVAGIELISVAGQSDGVFRKADGTRIVAGAYDYDLVKRDGQNWYLSNILPTAASATTRALETGVSIAPVNAFASSAATPGAYTQVWRPESGSYAANLLAANTLFNTSLHDRAGESQYTDILTGKQQITSLWLRNVGGHQRSRMSDGQNKTQANRYVLQIGGDLAQWSGDGRDRYRLGVMAGYANQKSRTHSAVTNYTSRGQVNGYASGLYGTWYADHADKSGLYVDSWLQYSWFDNSVKGDSIHRESYKSHGVTGSVEAGYAFNMAESISRTGMNNSLWLQPQAQVFWMGVKAKNHTESNGTRVQSSGQNNVRTRLGLKAYVQSRGKVNSDNGRSFQPYITANWIYNARQPGVKMDNESNVIHGARHVGEVKVGVEGHTGGNLNLWGGVSQQVGSKGYSDSQPRLD